ncbi:MAG: 23S rRNA (uracil(1939)-C(5))-methyltransferase RlmD [Acidobacteriaceae bacterium]|nr:23S rRNA (uracil(1939)-C(5))-methyltransferase RlmD [Acidobacteriaceae bacterium]
MSKAKKLRLTQALYGGEVLTEDGTWRIPFGIPGESVAIAGDNLSLVEKSPERVSPTCVHFGSCGGCQYQMASYDEQLRMKHSILRDELREAGVKEVPEIFAQRTGEPYGYRNRIRLRVEREDGKLHFGYNRRGTATFLPVTMCPIAADPLWSVVEALQRVAAENVDAAAWLEAAKDVELFANEALDKVQMTLLCPPRTKQAQGSFVRMMKAVSEAAPSVVGAGAVAVDAKVGLTGKVFEEWGAAGLSYRVGEESYWVSRGGFFQVNRFLLPELVELVTAGRSGTLAWDLFAGVGLFSRVLARSFAQVTAVESHPGAAKDLATALKKLGKEHRAVESTTLAFLQRAVMERELPELVVLDPPRAGAGEEACELLVKMQPKTVVYVSCDPTTLARDWSVLEQGGYRAQGVTMVDLFPQTFHMETVVVFERQA